MKKSSSERQREILDYVLKKEEVSISELSQRFNVTMETVRKDVNILETKNLLVKEHGYVLSTKPYDEASMNIKSEENKEAKMKIAEIAVSMIPEKASLILDSGSTTLHLAKLLLSRDDLIIFTNSLPIVDLLTPSDNKVFMIGGALRRENQSFTGPWTEMILKQISVDIAFVSCNGFSKEGPKIHSYGEMGVKKMMVNSSGKTILLADSSKFSQPGIYCYASFSKIDVLVSERPLTKHERELFPDDLILF